MCVSLAKMLSLSKYIDTANCIKVVHNKAKR